MSSFVSHFTTILVLALYYLFVSVRVVHAYLDPGSGSFLFQILIGTLLGLVMSVKVYWGRIRNFFVKFFSRKKRTSENEGKE